MSEFGMSKMESNEIMNTNMEEIKMCGVEELIRNNISRTDITIEKEKDFNAYSEEVCIAEQK